MVLVSGGVCALNRADLPARFDPAPSRLSAGNRSDRNQFPVNFFPGPLRSPALHTVRVVLPAPALASEANAVRDMAEMWQFAGAVAVPAHRGLADFLGPRPWAGQRIVN